MKAFVLKISVLMVLLCMAISLSACSLDQLFGTGNADEKVETSRPTNCWISDTMLTNYLTYPSMEDLFGNGGDSGLRSEYLMEEEAKVLRTNPSQNCLVCLIYGSAGTAQMAWETYLKFSLVTETQVLYDEECVEVLSPSVISQNYGIEVNIDMSRPADGRVVFSKDDADQSIVQICVVIPFVLNQEGTLYVDFRVDCPEQSKSQTYYVNDHAAAEIGEENPDATKVTIQNFCAKYLTEEKYNMGAYSDSDLLSAPVFENDTVNYMVMDFEYSANTDNDGSHAIHIITRVPESEILYATIEDAPTGKIEEAVGNNATTIYASYNVPPKAGETKKIRMVIKLKPLNEGVASVDVFLTGDGNTQTVGNRYITQKIVLGTPDLRYVLSRDKTYYIADSLWQSNVPELTIPDTYMGLPVEELSPSLLKGNMYLKNLVISNNVKRIAENAFNGCTALQSVTLGNGLSNLPSGLFRGCSALRSVNLPEGTTSIPYEFFSGCSSLTTVEGTSSVTEIKGCAFEGCSMLQTLNCADITYLGNAAFRGCSSMTEVNTLRVTTVPESAFEGCSTLRWFDLTGVEIVQQRAFFNCSSFTEIVIPDSCYLLHEEAFAGTSGVRSLYIGKNANATHPSSWGGIFDKTSLESIEVSAENTRYYSSGNCFLYRYNSAIDGSERNTLYLGCKNSVIPNGVQYIGEAAFRGCTGLREISLPEGIEQIDRYAFEGCTGLTQVTIPSSVNQIWQYAFRDCTALTRVNMPSSWYVSNGPDTSYAGTEKIKITSPGQAAEFLTQTYCEKYFLA